MNEPSNTLKPWVTFAGSVLIVVVLYWAQAVLVPIALAILICVRPGAAGDLARALARPRPGGADRRHAGVRRAGPGRLGPGAADGEPGRRPARATASTSWRRSPTCAAPARAARSRSCRRRSRTSRPTSARPRRRRAQPRAGRRGHLASSSSGFPGIRVARTDRRAAGHRRPGGGAGDLHAARTPRSARSADRPVRAGPPDGHDQGVRRSRQPRQPAAADAVAGQPDLRRGRRARPLPARRAVSAGVGRARRGASLHPVRRSGHRRRRADPRQPGRPAGLDRSALGGGHVRRCSSCSPTWCSKPCCTRARPACRRWRCWSRWRSGRGCGDRSAC